MQAVSLPDPLTDRRRVAVAVVLGLLVQAVAIGAIGFVAAGDRSSTASSPGALELPRPRVGDRGNYTAVLAERTADGFEPVNEPREVVGFRILPDREMYDGEGQLHRVNELYVRKVNEHGTHAWVASLVAGGFRPIAVGSLEEGTSTDEEGDVSATRDRQTRFVSPDEERLWGLCGLRNVLQGRRVDVDRPVELFTNCRVPAYPAEDGMPPLPHTFRDRVRECRDTANGAKDCRSPPQGGEGWYTEHIPTRRFEVNGTGTLGDHEVVRFTYRSDPPGERRVHVWFTPDLPYPAQITFTGVFSDQYAVLRLANFTRGDGPPIRFEDAHGPQAPEVRMADRTITGPSEEGLDHPFPLSEAFAKARDNPRNSTLRDFLDAHPDAAVVTARFHNLTWHGDTLRQNRYRYWTFTVTDGADALNVDVQAARRSADVQDPTPVESPEGPRTLYYDYDDVGDRDWPRPDTLPDRLPTVASTMARWRAYAPDRHADNTPNTWSFYPYCDRSCQAGLPGEPEMGMRISAGWSGSSTNSTGEHQASSTLTVDDDGDTLSVRNYRRRTRYDADGSDPFPPTEDGTAIQSTGIPVAAWLMPSEETAAAVGLVAAITALLYWAWPALKTLPLAPFHTRLKRDELLDHDARRRIVSLVQETPGIHLSEIRRRVGLGEGTTRHHLHKLVAADLVAEASAEGFTCYFPPGEIDRRLMDAAPYLRSSSARAILEAVADDPGATNGEIAARTGLSPSTVSYHVDRLQEAGMVDARRAGRRKEIALTERGRRALGAFVSA